MGFDITSARPTGAAPAAPAVNPVRKAVEGRAAASFAAAGNATANAAQTNAGLPYEPKRAKAVADKAVSDAIVADAAAAEASRQRALNAPDLDAVRDTLAATIEGAMRAKHLSRSRFAATGFGSDFVTGAGAPVHAVKGALSPAKANIALQKLAEMAKAGIKLTPISNVDIELMMSSLAGMDTAQDDESFQLAMDTIIEHFGNAMQKMDRRPTPAGARAALEARRRAAAQKAK